MNRILSLLLAAVSGAVVMALFGTIGVTLGHGSGGSNFPSMVVALPTPYPSPSPPPASVGQPIGAIAVVSYDLMGRCWDYVVGVTVPSTHCNGLSAVRLSLSGDYRPAAALLAQLSKDANRYQLFSYAAGGQLLGIRTETNQTPGPINLGDDRFKIEQFLYKGQPKIVTVVLLLSNY